MENEFGRFAEKTRVPLVFLVLTLLTCALSPGPVLPARAEAVTGTIAVGNNPDGIGVDTSSNRIYVSNYGLNGTFPSTVSVINGSNNGLIATILVGVNPGGIAVNSVNHRIYVANYNSSNVSVIDGTTNNVIATIGVGNHPSKVAINPTTNEVYVTNNADNTVSRIDGATNTLVGTTSVGRSPVGIALLQSTNTLYVVNSKDNTVSIIDGVSHTVIKTLVTGNDPGNVALNSATNTVFVEDSNSSMITVINGSTNALAGNISVGLFPSGLDVNPSTNKIYVANSADGTISVVDGFTSQEVNTVTLPIGTIPGAVGVNPVTNEVYVANGGRKTLSVISGRITSTSLSCNPSSVSVNGNTSCKATVSDISGSGASIPTGTVFFASNGQGVFNATACTLGGTGTTATCSISFSPTVFGSGHQTIFATYGGDSAHMSGSGSTTISLIDSTVGGVLIPINQDPSSILFIAILLVFYVGAVTSILYAGRLRRNRYSDDSNAAMSNLAVGQERRTIMSLT